MVNIFNSFMSYVLLVLVCVAVAGAGFCLGLFLRKKKNQSLSNKTQENSEQ